LGVNENAYAEVSAPVQARVTALQATSGQSVRSGQALVTLESGELAKARSDVATARARVVLAQRTLERRQGRNAERIVPAREVQEAESEKASADAQLQAALASLQAFGITGPPEHEPSAALTLRAPVAGVVLERAAILGQMADPSKALFRVGDLSTLWLTVHAF